MTSAIQRYMKRRCENRGEEVGGAGNIAVVTTSSGAAPQAAGLGLVPALLGLVRFSHTIFALPFALSAALLAEMAIPDLATLGWILLAMVGARSLAMALNRIIDAI